MWYLLEGLFYAALIGLEIIWLPALIIFLIALVCAGIGKLKSKK